MDILRAAAHAVGTVISYTDSAGADERREKLGSAQPAVDAQLLLGLLAGLEVDRLSAEPDAIDQAAIRAVIGRAARALFPPP